MNNSFDFFSINAMSIQRQMDTNSMINLQGFGSVQKGCHQQFVGSKPLKFLHQSKSLFHPSAKK